MRHPAMPQPPSLRDQDEKCSLIAAAAAVVVVREAAPALIGKIVEYVHIAESRIREPEEGKTVNEPPEKGAAPEEDKDGTAAASEEISPLQPGQVAAESGPFTALERGRTVTIWLRSGWKVTSIWGDNSTERVFFRFDKATAVKQRDRRRLRGAGPQAEVTGEPVLVPVQDIELITVVPKSGGTSSP